MKMKWKTDKNLSLYVIILLSTSLVLVYKEDSKM